MGFKVGEQVQVIRGGSSAGHVGRVAKVGKYISVVFPNSGALAGGEYRPEDLARVVDDACTAEKPRVRSTVLSEAERVITKDRQDQYGDAEDCFGDIAALWTTYKRHTFTAHDVAVMMALLKVARIKSSPGHADNYVDLLGYGALAAEMAQ